MNTVTSAEQNPGFQTLLCSPLAAAEGVEVLVSTVSISANTTPPLHWHPGEEFAFLLSGSVTLLQQGKPDVKAIAGDAVVVPHKQIHTIKTGDEGATVLIFSVHEKGQPERVLVG
ncbi:MAG: quercetin dioxygenase-like cupin family protein [Parasphingorhabdus sp.]|jgi:quercetin dioxygenase-like cupin family protein